MNRQSDLLETVVFDGYDFGLKLQFLEGANRLLLDRGGYFIRRNDHPMYRFWRLSKDKLLRELEAAQSAPDRQAFTWKLVFRIAPLTLGGVLLSGEYHPGAVSVARRMRGVFLGQSKSWRVDASAELVRSNLILELGLSEDQFEILDTVQELLTDGSVVPAETITRIELGGPPQERSLSPAADDSSTDVYLAAIPTIERTELTSAQITQALTARSSTSRDSAPAATHQCIAGRRHGAG